MAFKQSSTYDKVRIYSLTVASYNILGRKLWYIVDLIIQLEQDLALCPPIVNVNPKLIWIYRRQEVRLLVNDSDFLVLKSML